MYETVLHAIVLLPCIFGFDSEDDEDDDDDLRHYLSCDPIWTLAASASAIPSAFLLLAPLDRLCLLNRSQLGLKLLSMVFRSYHALKMGHRTVFDHCISTGNFDEITLLALRIFSNLRRH